MGAGHQHAGSTAHTHRARLALVLGITSAVLVVEVIGAALTGSLALLADAGHLLTDVAGLSLALLAVIFASRAASPRRSYGYYRLEILAAVTNAVLLLVVATLVIVEAVRRLGTPPDVDAPLMLVFAAIGLVANGVGLLLLRGGQRESLNIRGAYLEVMGDLFGSVTVVVAAALIAVTGSVIVDPIASILVGGLIVPRAWTLLRDAVDVLLEATPKHIDLDELRAHMIDVDGVVDVHDLHIWTITSGMPVMSAHVVVDETQFPHAGRVLDQLMTCLSDHFDVEHSTFQLEPVGHTGHEAHAHA